MVKEWEILYTVLSTETNPLLLVGSRQVEDEQALLPGSCYSSPSAFREPSILISFSFVLFLCLLGQIYCTTLEILSNSVGDASSKGSKSVGCCYHQSSMKALLFCSLNSLSNWLLIQANCITVVVPNSHYRAPPFGVLKTQLMGSMLHETCFGEEGEAEMQSPYPHRSSCKEETSESLKINSKASKATQGHQDKHQKAILRFRVN